MDHARMEFDDAPTTLVQVLGIEGTLTGRWSERMGTDLAFLEDGRLLIGAPSYPHGDTFESEDDRCWLTEGGAGIIPSEVGAVVLQDPWGDDIVTQPSSLNRFGYRVLAAGDLTGDGNPDIAIANVGAPESYEVEWGVFAGPDYTMSFALPAWSASDRGAPCGDIDGDGISELCTSDGVLFGPISEDSTLALSWTAEDPIISGADLDGDGQGELVVSDASAHAVYHLASLTRAGQVVLADIAADTWTAQNGGATALAAGDLDGDGTDEVIAGWSGSGDDVVLVGLSPGGGDVFAAARSTLPVRAEELAVGDFDGDGQDDLAVGGASEVTLWLGPIEPGTRLIEEAAARYRGLEFPSDQFGFALAAADTDGDGRSELAIGAPFDNAPDEPCQESANHSCYVPGRVWWLSGGGL